MDNMNITNAQYVVNDATNQNAVVKCDIDGQEWHVPMTAGNRHYDEIMKQVAAGDLTIADAD
jgi:hypothetical protein